MNAYFLATPDAALAWLAQQPLADTSALMACGEDGAWRRRLVEAVLLLAEVHLVGLATEHQGKGFPCLDHPETGLALDTKSFSSQRPGLGLGLSGPAFGDQNYLFTSLHMGHIPALACLEGVPAGVVQQAFMPLVDAVFHKALNEPLSAALGRYELGIEWPAERRAWELEQALPSMIPVRPKTPRF
mgnify:CR=1 FL=1